MASEKILEGRIARLRELMETRGYDAVVLRNNPDLRWLTGAERTFDDELAHTAFITMEKVFLHTDSRYYNTFIERLGEDSIWQIDMESITPTNWVAQRAVETHSQVIALEDTLHLGFFDQLQVSMLAASISAQFPRMHGDIATILRAVKDEEEIELMKKAQSITDAAFEHICGFIKPGMTEMEIKNELEGFMFANGADSLSFDSIVASGPNGANPHAQPSDRKVQEGEFIVIDFGAGYRDYHSDMTRTICVGEPTDEMVDVYNIVKVAHEECAKAVRAGVIGKDIHDLSVKIISDAGYGEYYGHGLGHGVGVEIHEQPNFNPRCTTEIPEGAVLTIEPGIYLPGKFGIRLEDFGLVTKDGYEAFTQSPHELTIVNN